MIGENFELIDTKQMRDTLTLYSLTRHGNRGFGDCEIGSMCHMTYHGMYIYIIIRLFRSYLLIGETTSKIFKQ